MKIEITITDDEGELLQHSESLSIENAVDELYRFDRHNPEHESI